MQGRVTEMLKIVNKKNAQKALRGLPCVFYFGNKKGLVVTIRLLAGELAGPALRFCGLTDARFGWFLVMTAHFHFAEKAFALHLFLQCAQCLVNIVIAYNYFNQKNIPPIPNYVCDL